MYCILHACNRFLEDLQKLPKSVHVPVRGRCLCSLLNLGVYAECRSLLLSICQGAVRATLGTEALSVPQTWPESHFDQREASQMTRGWV